MTSDNLNKQDLKNLYCVFENSIRSVISNYKFAMIPKDDWVKLIDSSLSECQIDNNVNDMYATNILLKNVLKENIINYLKNRYQTKEIDYVTKIIENKKNSYFPIRTLQDAINCLLNIIGLIKEIDFLVNYEVLELLIKDKFITSLLDLIIQNNYQEIASLNEKDIIVELIIMYKPEISKAEIRIHWYNLFGLLCGYETDLILEAINKLPIEYKNMLVEVFGPNYDAVNNPKCWNREYEYTIRNIIIPLIISLIDNNYYVDEKLKNNSQIRNLSLFKMFSKYSFDLILYIINSLSDDNKKILQGKFGINYNEVLFDDNWIKKYSKTCYKVILPYIFKRAKELTDKNISIVNKDLLSIFGNYDSFLVISAINDLTEFEIKYLQSLYGTNYNEILLNKPLYNIEFLNIILERISTFLQTKHSIYEEEKNEVDLLTLLSDYNQELVKNAIDSLSEIDKEKLERRYGKNYNKLNNEVNSQVKKEIKSKIIPRIIKIVSKFEGKKVIGKAQLTRDYNIFNMQELIDSLEYQELTTFLANDEAIIIILKFIGFKGIYFNFETIAKILNISVLEVRNIFNTAIEKYKTHKKNTGRKLVL